MTALAPADHFDRHKLNLVASPNESQQHLGLELEVVCLQAECREGLRVNQPKPALRIRQTPAGEP